MTGTQPVILIMHDPGAFLDKMDRPSLTVAGHTHGGQMLPWILKHMHNPYSRAPMKYLYGRIDEEGRTMIVTDGIGTSIVPLRLGAVPEIVSIKLEQPKPPKPLSRNTARQFRKEFIMSQKPLSQSQVEKLFDKLGKTIESQLDLMVRARNDLDFVFEKVAKKGQEGEEYTAQIAAALGVDMTKVAHPVEGLEKILAAAEAKHYNTDRLKKVLPAVKAIAGVITGGPDEAVKAAKDQNKPKP